MGKLRILFVSFAIACMVAAPAPAFANGVAGEEAATPIEAAVGPDAHAAAGEFRIEDASHEAPDASAAGTESMDCGAAASQRDDDELDGAGSSAAGVVQVAAQDADIADATDRQADSGENPPSEGPADETDPGSAEDGEEPDAGEGPETASESGVSDDANPGSKSQGASRAAGRKQPAVSCNVKGAQPGWQGWKGSGKTAGLREPASRVTAIRIKVENLSVKGSVQYQLYSADSGWQAVGSDGEVAKAGGSAAESLRVALTGKLSKLYSVKYRVCTPGGAWRAWKRDGAVSSAAGERPIGAVQIKLVKRKAAAAQAGEGLVGVRYRSRMKGAGWQAQCSDGAVSGNAKAGASIVGFMAAVDAGAYGGGVSYKAYVDGAWAKRWTKGGKAVGAPAGGKALEALKVKLVGGLAKRYDVLYRVSIDGSGWQDWTYNGHAAGLAGQGKAVQALWVKLVKKGEARKLAEGTYRIAVSSKRSMALVSPRSGNKGAQARSQVMDGAGVEKFLVRDEGSGLVSLQSVATGLFLAQSSGKVVQLGDRNSASLRWKTVWDDGYAFVNSATGKVLSLAGGKVVADARAVVARDASRASQRWWPVAAKLVDDGYYSVVSAKRVRLAVANRSYSRAANVASATGRVTGAQVFRIYERDPGRYVIENAQSFLVVGVSGSSLANKANVVQDRLVRSASQLWKPLLDRSGYFKLVNARSGKALEVAGSKPKAGSNVVQNSARKAKGQLWKLSATKRYSLSGDEELDRTVASILATHTTLKAAYDHVAFDYHYISANEIRGGRYLSQAQSVAYAKEFQRNGGGNCYRFSSMMSWLARGLGYSSRVVTGWVPGRLEPRAPHGWCEVYRDGSTYVCDPDMYNAVRYRDWYMQTYASAPVAYGFW